MAKLVIDCSNCSRSGVKVYRETPSFNNKTFCCECTTITSKHCPAVIDCKSQKFVPSSFIGSFIEEWEKLPN